MKQDKLPLTVGCLLVAIFAMLLFAFQVRQTEVAVVTTFGKPTRPIAEPGLYCKWPWPIQKVYKFDKRIQNFEGKFEETLTQDGQNLLIMVYAGWNIADPEVFLQRFANGSVTEAERSLEGLVRTAKNGIVGQHSFSHFISTNEKELKFTEIEQAILDSIKGSAKSKYGIEIKFLGIKKLGLPESITQKVFDRMRAERQRQVLRFQGEGESQSIQIRTTADRDRDEILAKAEGEAKRIVGEGDAKAAQAYKVFEQAKELALYLLGLNALEQTLKERATLILDERTPPFNLLNQKFEATTNKKPQLTVSP